MVATAYSEPDGMQWMAAPMYPTNSGLLEAIAEGVVVWTIAAPESVVRKGTWITDEIIAILVVLRADDNLGLQSTGTGSVTDIASAEAKPDVAATLYNGERTAHSSVLPAHTTYLGNVNSAAGGGSRDASLHILRGHIDVVDILSRERTTITAALQLTPHSSVVSPGSHVSRETHWSEYLATYGSELSATVPYLIEAATVVAPTVEE